MKKQTMTIAGVPAILYGERSQKVLANLRTALGE